MCYQFFIYQIALKYTQMALLIIEQTSNIADIVGLDELKDELMQILQIDEQIAQSKVNQFLYDFTVISKTNIHERTLHTERDWKDVVREFNDQLHVMLHNFNLHIQADQPTSAFVEQILEEMIRPALEAHGGDIELIYLTDSIAGLKLKGACQGCPFSLQTLTMHIARIMGMYFPCITTLHIM